MARETSRRRSWAVGILILALGSPALAKQPTSPIPFTSLQKRSPKLNMLSGLSQDDGGGGDAKGNRDPCQPFEIDPQTWVDLDVDAYLQNYPNAEKLTLHEFAQESNVPNFFCGVGMQCLAGQLCHPAKGINWLILYAAQQWATYLNSLYKAVENAVELVRDTASSIVADFAPTKAPDTSLWWWSLGNVLCGVVGTFTALAVAAFLPADAIAVSAAIASGGPAAMGPYNLGSTSSCCGPANVHKSVRDEGREAYEAAKKAAKARNLKELEKQSAMQDVQAMQHIFLDDSYKSRPGAAHYQAPDQVVSEMQRVFSAHDPFLAGGEHKNTQPTIAPKTPKPSAPLQCCSRLHKRGRPSAYAFTRYTYIEPHLNALQNRIQGFVALTLKLGTTAPILADGGLASILSQGSFLTPNPSENKLQEGGKKLAEILVLGQFFRGVNMFVTIGSDPCKFKGPNGAKDKANNLSYCTPDGLMMNIIQANDDKALNEIQNANLLKEKYGYTVEFLTKSAWDCQKKYGIYTTAQAPPPSNMKSDCIFQIAVCDCTLPEVALLRSKKKSTVVACREGAGLPI